MKKLLTTLALLSLCAGAYAAISPEVQGHLDQADKAADALSADMDNLLQEHRDAPRGSEERRELRRDLKDLDCEVERIEGRHDEIEDRVHSACWCNGCR